MVRGRQSESGPSTRPGHIKTKCTYCACICRAITVRYYPQRTICASAIKANFRQGTRRFAYRPIYRVQELTLYEGETFFLRGRAAVWWQLQLCERPWTCAEAQFSVWTRQGLSRRHWQMSFVIVCWTWDARWQLITEHTCDSQVLPPSGVCGH